MTGSKVGRAPTITRNSVLIAGLFILIAFVAVNGSLDLFDQESVLTHLDRWLTLDHKGDSWWPMKNSYRWFKETDTHALYQDIFFQQRLKFQYSPTSLLPLAIADRLGIDASIALLNWTGILSVIVEACSVAVLAVRLGRRTAAIKDDWISLSIAAGIAAIACVTFYPVVKAHSLGQIQTWINACFAAACLCWFADRKLLAGVLIGAACLVKPQFGLFLIWGGLRREWTFLAGWALIVAPSLILSIRVFGLSNHLDYLTVLQFISRHGETYYSNQTVNGFLNRTLGNGDNLIWHDHEFAPFNVVVYGGTLISSGILVLSAVLFRARANATNLFDFLIAGITFTVASPIAWEHHYGVLPPAFAALFFVLGSMPRSRARTFRLGLLWTAFVLAANYLPFTQVFADTSANFVQSYLLFAALVVLWLLYRLRDGSLPRAAIEPLTPTAIDEARRGSGR